MSPEKDGITNEKDNEEDEVSEASEMAWTADYSSSPQADEEKKELDSHEMAEHAQDGYIKNQKD